ncbi:DNA damage-repair/toleration protein DRT102 [Camellia lanceoleosa]|uniref:DNA damage-repair/toleration protein DRT102 n=1 Tax=Camellia lanceoleosa TaxID=1840588 RepID=A0ACC0G073_9ERIC|nr:DNA damage-repair/toleration protein DRT102 [Camellia lanceoleosa]
MSKIGSNFPTTELDTCAICCLTKTREFTPIEVILGGSMKILRETNLGDNEVQGWKCRDLLMDEDFDAANASIQKKI